MTKKQRGRLDADTCMANLSADKCFQALSEGRFFSLEHPEGSIARSLPSWKKLASHPEVETIRYTTCMFEGSERRKRQVLLTNVSTMRAVIGKVCNGTMVCDRTGKKHKRWRPQVKGGRVTQFSTGEEREYPIGFLSRLRQRCCWMEVRREVPGDFLRSKRPSESSSSRHFWYKGSGRSNQEKGTRGLEWIAEPESDCR